MATAFNFDLLHPKAQNDFRLLAAKLEDLYAAGVIPVLFRPFEGYRSPERQLELWRKVPRVTKARPWQSSHNYGLAVDFVAVIDGKWNWDDVPKSAWDDLRAQSQLRGLFNTLNWDRPHVEHWIWRSVSRHLV